MRIYVIHIHLTAMVYLIHSYIYNIIYICQHGGTSGLLNLLSYFCLRVTTTNGIEAEQPLYECSICIYHEV